MSDTDIISMVGLYIKGDQLDPDAASRVLGATPTVARRKGVRGVSKEGVERSYVYNTGVWAVTVEKKAPLSDCLPDLLRTLGEGASKILEVPYADDCYVDILLSLPLVSPDDNTHSFSLSETDIAGLSKLNVPVHFTVSFVKD